MRIIPEVPPSGRGFALIDALKCRDFWWKFEKGRFPLDGYDMMS